MRISISEARAKLSALVNAALAGEEVILTKYSRPVAEIRPLAAKKSPAEKLAALQKIAAGTGTGSPGGVPAAKADNFLYDDDTGLPS